MKVVLLDRDGTIIAEPPDEQVDSVDKIKLLPHTLEALTYLARHDFAAILVTNQVAIARGRLTPEGFEFINQEVIKQLAPSGIKILQTYMSPHDSTEINDWRKPGPGMLLKAAEDFGLDLENTWMIGDRPSDVEAGKAAGTKTILLSEAPDSTESATHVAPNLLEAAKYIVSQE